MNAPLFWHFFCFCSFLIIKTKLSTNPVHDRGSMDPWSMFCPHPNNFGNYNVDLVQAESLRRMWEREDHYTVFQYFFQSKRNVKMYLGDVIIQTISRGIFNSIFYCSYSRNYLIWRAIASPQTFFGDRSSRIHSHPRSLSPTDRGGEMNAWRTNPKQGLRGLLTSKSDFLTFISRLLVNWD